MFKKSNDKNKIKNKKNPEYPIPEYHFIVFNDIKSKKKSKNKMAVPLDPDNRLYHIVTILGLMDILNVPNSTYVY